ncbi:MAG TPA: Mut7-C RNAse domain-containing protein [Candidatus Bathyarchaeia archaeon]|nr:Mut7-C RNAse domain-containing protein [Candidatus Bathyarchaeia archaeon]
MKFVVDGMLGSLTRWLRMLGHDVDYDPERNDNALLKISLDENRTLLTRDEQLYGRARSRAIPSFLVPGEKESERLGFLAKVTGISLEVNMAETRCPRCGAELRQTAKAEIAGEVPSKSAQLYDEYWKCENRDCGKVYWIGSHWKQIHHILEEARKLAGSRFRNDDE